MFCTVLSVGFEVAVMQTREDVGMLRVKIRLSDITEVPLTVNITSMDSTATGTPGK